MAKYKCVKAMMVEVVGDDGSFIENEHMQIELGSVWEEDDRKYRFIGGSDSIRLEDEAGRWMEIYEDNLANHFIQTDA